jgi:2-polyprenyl-3-methyl-5-hydroxy-6-metoxy-1,4-benzoquinol methylase
MRPVTAKEYCHERLGDQFSRALSTYDTRRRVQVLIDDFLSPEMVRTKAALDVGCGLGFFSERLQQRGADVIACDLGPTLVEKTRQRVGCQAKVVDALALVDYFGPERFDLVVSSECIEHTPAPATAVAQMAAVLRRGGYLAISTPNYVWLPVVRMATALGLRPFDGLEKFSSWPGLRKTLQSCGLRVLREFGLHLFPFQLGCHRFSTWCDGHLQSLRGLMINICVLAHKEPD